LIFANLVQVPAVKAPAQRLPSATLEMIERIKCWCGATDENQGTEKAVDSGWVQCNWCGTWEHKICAEKNPNMAYIAELKYYACHACCQNNEVALAALQANADIESAKHASVGKGKGKGMGSSGSPPQLDGADEF
jgi:hypothetical protein